jgi:hypothetical protein
MLSISPSLINLSFSKTIQMSDTISPPNQFSCFVLLTKHRRSIDFLSSHELYFVYTMLWIVFHGSICMNTLCVKPIILVIIIFTTSLLHPCYRQTYSASISLRLTGYFPFPFFSTSLQSTVNNKVSSILGHLTVRNLIQVAM